MPLASAPLENGGVVTGSISIPEEEDTYTFTTNAGEGVQLRVAEIANTSDSGSFDPGITLYGPDGTDLAHGHGSSVGAISYQITENGIYTVVVADTGTRTDQTGDYNLYFVLVPGANEGGSLNNGGVISDAVVSDSIDLGDLDSYTFTANAGESIQIRAARINDIGFAPRITLYGPDGAYIIGRHNTRVADLTHQITENGTYTVVISDQTAGYDATGSYDLYFVRIPGANEGGALNNGGVVSGAIDLGDLDSYTFTANVGENIEIRINNTSSIDFAPRITLYGPDGTYITHQHDRTVARIILRNPENGTYTVIVSDGNSHADQTGTYNLELEIANDFLSYAALGDSYSSGEGVPPYIDAADDFFTGCHRSTRAYATRIRTPGTTQAIADRADAHFDFLACSGAVTNNVTASGAGQNGDPPQLAAVNGVNASRDLITMTIGGNDAYFVWILAYCFVHNHCNDLKPFDLYLDIELGDLAPLWLAVVRSRLINLYSELRSATPNAPTLVMGYPILVSGQECAAVKVPFYDDIKLSESEQAFLRDANQQLNATIAEATAQVGLHFIPVADHFEGHEVCGSLDDWIYGLLPSKASFHPTNRGQLEYARVVNAYLEGVRNGWPFGYHPTELPRNPDPLLAPLVADNAAAADEPSNPLPSFGDLDVALATAPTGCEESRDLVVPGESAAISGKGFVPSETVTLSLVVGGATYSLGTANADTEGNLATSVPIPADAPVGAMGTVEALAAGPDGVGLLLFDLVRIDQAITVDGDADGIPDGCDNCPSNANADQSDLDLDGQGDACDLCPEEFPNDEDGDGLCGAVDACPLDPNNDADGDGFCATDDNCAITANADQADEDGDGTGDACEALACYPLDLEVRAQGAGEIAVDAPNCGLDSYFEDTPITLDALPASSNFFTGWTGDLSSTSNPLQMYVTSATALTANFCDSTIDSDGDLVADACDSCTQVANPSQRDTDGDGFGNACDADFNNSGVVDGSDYGFFISVFGTNDADADLNGNGVVDGGDYGLFISVFGQEPGPSGLVQ